MNPKAIAAIIANILKTEDEIISVAKELGPLAAELPAPFNAVADPRVQEALNFLPKLTPFLTELETILASLPA